MLEVHQLRQSLNTVRQELSHALYQVRRRAWLLLLAVHPSQPVWRAASWWPPAHAGHPAARPRRAVQHDAACRVIARLMRERDGYRQQLEAAQRAAPADAGAGKRGAGEAMEVDEGPAKKVGG